MLLEIRIPFDGFYSTMHGVKCDDRELMEFCVENNIIEDLYSVEDLTAEMYEKFDNWRGAKYQDIQKEYCEEYTQNFFKRLNRDIKLQYKTSLELKPSSVVMTSPREYNFTTDRIFCKVDYNLLFDLFCMVDKKILDAKIKEDYTSYDGFASFYDNSVSGEDWKDAKNFDHNQWCTVLEAVMQECDFTSEELYELNN